MNQAARPFGARPWARAISADIYAALPQQGQWRGRVMDCHARACNIWLGHQPTQLFCPPILSLVDASLGKAPGVVGLEVFSAIQAAIDPGGWVFINRHALCLSHWRIGLDDCEIWNPKPDWQHARHANWRRAVAAACSLDQPQSLLCLLNAGAGMPCSPIARQMLRHVSQAIDAIDWPEAALPYAGLARAAHALAGLGIGLTPAGDDFLCGIMLACWLLDEHAAAGCAAIAKAASALTTPLSAAFLGQAAQGYCRAPWHHLLAAVIAQNDSAIIDALNAVAAQGATSGADSLAGFFWVLQKTKTGVIQ